MKPNLFNHFSQRVYLLLANKQGLLSFPNSENILHVSGWLDYIGPTGLQVSSTHCTDVQLGLVAASQERDCRGDRSEQSDKLGLSSAKFGFKFLVGGRPAGLIENIVITTKCGWI